MTMKRMWRSSLAAVVAVMLVRGSLWAQGSQPSPDNTLQNLVQTLRNTLTQSQSTGAPLQSLLDLYFAPDTATVENHLLKITRDGLAKVDARTRWGAAGDGKRRGRG